MMPCCNYEERSLTLAVTSRFMRLSHLVFTQLNGTSHKSRLQRLRVGRCVLMFRKLSGDLREAIQFAEVSWTGLVVVVCIV